MISPKKIPYRTAIGTTYDGGDFAAILDQALALHDYDGFKLRRRAAKARGKYRGVGISCFLEHSGGMPQESAALNFPGDDTLVLALNVQSTGQGHASVFPRIAAQRLGIAPDKIRHQHGDSDFELAGFASVASRSAMTAGAAIVRGIEAMLSKGKTLAAAALEAAESDMAYKDGRFEVIGTDRRIALFDLAKRAAEMARRGEIPESLDTRITTETPLAFPNGCHIAEVEVDPQTGDVATVAYTAVDDAGNVLDPMILEGQLHGALAQGIGQALKEVAAYESGSGQLVTASFMDYAMPRAEDMPPMKDASHPVPATTNPLGVKGVGEAATIASIAAVMNAIADAIPNGAAAHMDMPATPERVWQACRKAAMN
jgi:carbon-monoxide dehydrogenase large subunit